MQVWSFSASSGAWKQAAVLEHEAASDMDEEGGRTAVAWAPQLARPNDWLVASSKNHVSVWRLQGAGSAMKVIRHGKIEESQILHGECAGSK